MSYGSNFDDDDIPDYIKEFIKNFSKQFGSIDPDELTDAMRRFNQIDPDELENMFKKMFGEDFLEKLSSIGENLFENLANVDPNNIPDFSNFNVYFAKMNHDKSDKTEIHKEDEEAYYEIITSENGAKEILVDLPGISDQRQIHWELNENTLNLKAENETVKYHCSIIIPSSSKLQNHLTRLNNSVFIMPLRSS